ncbi:MAG: hypothetical protein ACI9EV_002741 [Urechidicola sp.]|jgi:hypothetical protein
MNKPNFLFVGTAKAGTTSIYHYLSQHPDISIPVKETFYFLRDIYENNHLDYPKQRPIKDLVLTEDQYSGIYENETPEKRVGEIGTGYLYHHDVAIPRIKETLGDPKILIILRNPVTRCFSSHMHFVKDLHEKRSFSEALEQEKQRMDQGWDFMWHHKALGLYADQVKAYLESFSNVKVLISEEFSSNREETITDIFNFLGLVDMEGFQNLKTHNPSGVPKNARIQKFITHENPLKSLVRPVFRMVFSQEKRDKIRKTAKAKNLDKGQQIPSDLANQLKEFYRPDIEKLEKLLNKDLSIWKKADYNPESAIASEEKED